ncbi:MAG: hypothetical protein AB7N76_30950 [Planctomycetota bacterium]
MSRATTLLLSLALLGLAAGLSTADDEPKQPRPPRLKKVAVASLLYVHDPQASSIMDGSDLEQPRLRVQVLGFFSSRRVVGLRSARVLVARAANGADLLLPAKEQALEHELVSDEKKLLAKLTACLALPPAGVTGIKELSGEVVVDVATGKRQQVDLGLSQIKVGAQGTKHGAKITELKEQFGSWWLKVEFSGLERNAVAGGYVLTPQGKQLSRTTARVSARESSDEGAEGEGEQPLVTKGVDLELALEEAPPAGSKVMLVLWGKLEPLTLPWKLVDLDATGQPRAAEKEDKEKD